MIRNSKILITGGYGFIGGHLAEALSDEKLKNKLVIFDMNTGDQTTGSDLSLRLRANIEIIKGSILDSFDLVELQNDYDYIIHAAGFLGIDNVAEHQLLNMDINLQGTKNCLEVAKQQVNLKKFIQLSTSEIYGVESRYSSEVDDSVIKTTGKRWCYAASKLAAEYYLKAYVQEYDLAAAIVRPFNVYGPHRYGSNAMTALISKAINNENINVSGNGEQLRSWCHIDDFCNGVIGLMETVTDPGDAFNIGDDRFCLSIYELAKRIVGLTSSRSDIKILHNETEDVLERKPDISKAKNTLAYLPSRDLNQGIVEVADWLRESLAATARKD